MAVERRRSSPLLFVALGLVVAPVVALVMWLTHVPASWVAYCILASALAIALSMGVAERKNTGRRGRGYWTRSPRSQIGRTGPNVRPAPARAVRPQVGGTAVIRPARPRAVPARVPRAPMTRPGAARSSRSPRRPY
jgi:hypothetical protein